MSELSASILRRPPDRQTHPCAVAALMHLLLASPYIALMQGATTRKEALDGMTEHFGGIAAATKTQGAEMFAIVEGVTSSPPSFSRPIGPSVFERLDS